MIARAFALLMLFASVSSGAPLGLMVPAYFYPEPGGLWLSLREAARLVPLTAIMNPNNGPGASRDLQYVAAVTNLQQAGGRVIGYVATGYTSSNLITVKAEIDRYLAWYPVNGFFLDEMTDDASAAHLNYYTNLYQFIKSRNPALTVTGNPGINAAEEYLTRPAADSLVVFEVNTGYDSYVPDPWVTNHLARRMVHLPYAVSSATTMRTYIDLAAQRHAGWVYVTNDGGNNPWDTLPSYWLKEVDFIFNHNAAEVPIRLVAAAAGANVALRWEGPAGTYELQESIDLVHWAPILTRFTAAGSFETLRNTGGAQRFYRVTQ